MPDNWLLVGAALAMLPGARVVNVRRDRGGNVLVVLQAAVRRRAPRLQLRSFRSRRDLARLRSPEPVLELALPGTRARAIVRASCRRSGRRDARAARILRPAIRCRDACVSTKPNAACAPRAQRRSASRCAATPRAAPRTARGSIRCAACSPAIERRRETDASTRRNELAAARRARARSRRRRRARSAARGRAARQRTRRRSGTDHRARARRISGTRRSTASCWRARQRARAARAKRWRNSQRAAAAKPDDALILNTLGTAQAAAGDEAGALASFTRAMRDRSARGRRAAQSWQPARRARRNRDAQRSVRARDRDRCPASCPRALALAGALRPLGRDDDAAAQLREALARDPHSSAAWQGLAEMRPGRIHGGRAQRTRKRISSARDSPMPTARRSVTRSRNVLEARAQYPEAFASFVAANALRRRDIEWNSARHSRRCDRILEAFPAQSASRRDDARRRLHVHARHARRRGRRPSRARCARIRQSRLRAESGARHRRTESATRGQRFVQWATQATARATGIASAARISRHQPLAGSRTHRLLDAAFVRRRATPARSR